MILFVEAKAGSRAPLDFAVIVMFSVPQQRSFVSHIAPQLGGGGGAGTGYLPLAPPLVESQDGAVSKLNIVFDIA